MSLITAEYIWKNGEYLAWENAQTHVLTHALHYGTSVFEGIRAYKSDSGEVNIFRLKDHLQRFFYSARVYHMSIHYDLPTLMDACIELVAKNDLANCYIRPLAFLGYGYMGPGSVEAPTDICLIAYPLERHIYGEKETEEGIDVAVSSWRRVAPSTIPAGVKAAGNYLSSRLIDIEAKANGFHDGIGLAHDGNVSEGQASNIFLVKDKIIITPSVSASILSGITRDTVIQLAKAAGYKIQEQLISREMLYAADELFLTGTVAEITPVKSVDRLKVGIGKFPITKHVQSLFEDVIYGRNNNEWNWLQPVKTRVSNSA